MTCQKRSYINKKEAREALRSARSSPDPRRQEKRVYICDRCGMYHLTSHDTI